MVSENDLMASRLPAKAPMPKMGKALTSFFFYWTRSLFFRPACLVSSSQNRLKTGHPASEQPDSSGRKNIYNELYFRAAAPLLGTFYAVRYHGTNSN